MKINLRNFKTVKERRIDLDQDDILLLKGKSGIGKTTIIEAISWCLYKKPSGKTSEKDVRTKVSITTEEYRIVRYSSPCILKLRKLDQSFKDKEAQQIIEHMFGTYDLWRCTSYLDQFSSISFLSLNSEKKMKLINEIAFEDDPGKYIILFKKERKKSISENDQHKRLFHNTREKYKSYKNDLKSYSSLSINLSLSVSTEDQIRILDREHQILEKEFKKRKRIDKELTEMLLLSPQTIEQQLSQHLFELRLLDDQICKLPSFLIKNDFVIGDCCSKLDHLIDVQNRLIELKKESAKYERRISSLSITDDYSKCLDNIQAESLLSTKLAVSMKSTDFIQSYDAVKKYLREELAILNLKIKNQFKDRLSTKSSHSKIKEKIIHLCKALCIKNEDISSKDIRKQCNILSDKLLIRLMNAEQSDKVSRNNLTKSFLDKLSKISFNELFHNIEEIFFSPVHFQKINYLLFIQHLINEEMKIDLKTFCDKCGNEISLISKEELRKLNKDIQQIILLINEHQNDKTNDKEFNEEWTDNNRESLKRKDIDQKIKKIFLLLDRLDEYDKLSLCNEELLSNKRDEDCLLTSLKKRIKKYDKILTHCKMADEKLISFRTKTTNIEENIQKLDKELHTNNISDYLEELQINNLSFDYLKDNINSKQVLIKLKDDIKRDHSSMIRFTNKRHKIQEEIKNKQIILEQLITDINSRMKSLDSSLCYDHKQDFIKQIKTFIDGNKIEISNIERSKEIHEKKSKCAKIRDKMEKQRIVYQSSGDRIDALTNIIMKSEEIRDTRLTVLINSINLILNDMIPNCFDNLRCTVSLSYEKDKVDVNFFVNNKELKFNQLSGGEKERVMICFMMCLNEVSKLRTRNKLILLDECCNSLDQENREKVKEFIQKMSIGRLIICTDHNIDSEGNYNRIINLEES